MPLQSITAALFIGMLGFAIYLIWETSREFFKFIKAAGKPKR